jgi:hypothetical protein
MPASSIGRYRALRTDSTSCQQPSSDEEQVAEGEQREELGTVLGQTPVSGLEIPELTLEHPEGMLAPWTHPGEDPVDVLVDGMQRTAPGRLAYIAQNLPGPENAASRAALT